jgi:hypothetical protein
LKYADDLNALIEEFKRGEAALKVAGIVVIDPPPNPESLPHSALQRHRFSHQ